MIALSLARNRRFCPRNALDLTTNGRAEWKISEVAAGSATITGFKYIYTCIYIYHVYIYIVIYVYHVYIYIVIYVFMCVYIYTHLHIYI